MDKWESYDYIHEFDTGLTHWVTGGDGLSDVPFTAQIGARSMKMQFTAGFTRPAFAPDLVDTITPVVGWSVVDLDAIAKSESDADAKLSARTCTSYRYPFCAYCYNVSVCSCRN